MATRVRNTPASPERHEPSHAKSAAVTFVWIYLMLAGVLEVIYGIAALRNRGYFEQNDLLWSNLSAWAWLAIAIGAVQIVIAVLVYQRKPAGVIGGMAFAMFAFLSNFLSIGANPAWSITAMAVNGYVMWALPRAIET